MLSAPPIFLWISFSALSLFFIWSCLAPHHHVNCNFHILPRGSNFHGSKFLLHLSLSPNFFFSLNAIGVIVVFVFSSLLCLYWFVCGVHILQVTRKQLFVTVSHFLLYFVLILPMVCCNEDKAIVKYHFDRTLFDCINGNMYRRWMRSATNE